MFLSFEDYQWHLKYSLNGINKLALQNFDYARSRFHNCVTISSYKNSHLILQGINENLKIEDVAGRKYPAKTIISLFIRALADHLKLELKKQNIMETIKRGDIRWVLTVPAIWSDSAKAYMRKCAVEVS